MEKELGSLVWKFFGSGFLVWNKILDQDFWVGVQGIKELRSKRHLGLNTQTKNQNFENTFLIKIILPQKNSGHYNTRDESFEPN